MVRKTTKPKRKAAKRTPVAAKPPLTDTQKVEYFDKLSFTLEDYTPWLWEGSIWETEAKYWSWIRSQMRKVWSDWPLKNHYLRKQSIQVPKLDDYGNLQYYKTGSRKGKVVTVKGYKCEVTGEIVKASSPKGVPSFYNLDHIDEAGALTNGWEAAIYLFQLLCPQSNMQVLSTEYHKIKTYADKLGISIEEATAEKEVIAKLKQTVAKQKAELKKAGYSAAEISNGDKRRECYRKLLNKT